MRRPCLAARKCHFGMRFQDLSWMDVDRYLQQDNRVILITGATEQHAYLSLMTDVLVPERIAWAVGEQAGVLVAPSLCFGISGGFADFPGAICLSQMTFDAVVLEVVESLLHQGFRRFLVVNGHPGNRLPQRVRDLAMEGLIRLAWFDWWCGSAVKAVEAQHNLRADHANWGENFAFNRVGPCPAGVKPPVNLDETEDRSLRAVLGDGSYGGPYEVGSEIMQALFAGVVSEAAALLAAL